MGILLLDNNMNVLCDKFTRMFYFIEQIVSIIDQRELVHLTNQLISKVKCVIYLYKSKS